MTKPAPGHEIPIDQWRQIEADAAAFAAEQAQWLEEDTDGSTGT